MHESRLFKAEFFKTLDALRDEQSARSPQRALRRAKNLIPFRKTGHSVADREIFRRLDEGWKLSQNRLIDLYDLEANR